MGKKNQFPSSQGEEGGVMGEINTNSRITSSPYYNTPYFWNASVAFMPARMASRTTFSAWTFSHALRIASVFTKGLIKLKF